jgi:hypothetical protein
MSDGLGQREGVLPAPEGVGVFDQKENGDEMEERNSGRRGDGGLWIGRGGVVGAE